MWYGHANHYLFKKKYMLLMLSYIKLLNISESILQECWSWSNHWGRDISLVGMPKAAKGLSNLLVKVDSAVVIS